MDQNNYSGYFNGRFGDRTNADSDDDGFGDESLPSFLTKALEDDESLSIGTGKPFTHSFLDISNGSYKTDSILRSIDSSILVFGQFHTPVQISESFIKRPGPSAEAISDRMTSLLKNEDEIIHAMQKFIKLRYKRKDYQLNPLETFILLFLFTHYPNADEDTINRFHHYFWGGHSIDVLNRSLADIPKYDPSFFIQAFAAYITDAEKDYLHYDFTDLDRRLASVTQETYSWWKNSIDNQEQIEINEAPQKPELIDENISELESIVNYLNQKEDDLNFIATLISFETKIELKLKSTVIGDRDPDVDINLTSLEEFQIDENKEILCLIMLKSDLNFYIENLKEKSVFVNGYEIKQNNVTYLFDQSLIEFGNMSFLFSINKAFFTKLEKTMIPVLKVL